MYTSTEIQAIVSYHKAIQTAYRLQGNVEAARKQGSVLRRALMSPESLQDLNNGTVDFDNVQRLPCGSPLRTCGSATVDPDVRKILNLSKEVSHD